MRLKLSASIKKLISTTMAIYRDRTIAGKKLAEELKRHKYEKSLVLALPRGGLPVAYEVAVALGAPLDTIVARKIGLPNNPEYGVGAVAPEDVLVLREDSMRELGVTEKEIESIVLEEKKEMNMREDFFKSGTFSGGDFKTIIIVDDGLATGVTAEAAIIATKKRYSAEKIILAVPVSAPDTKNELESKVYELISLATPKGFGSVGEWYELFDQVTSEEARGYLEKRQHDLSNWP